MTPERWAEIKELKWNKRGRWFHISQTFLKKNLSFKPNPPVTYDPDREARLKRLKAL